MTKKRKTAKRKTTRKKPAPATRPYIEPKTAFELGYLCKGGNRGEECGLPPVWYDYAIGEVEHLRGFVCDAHKVSNRLEKLGQPKAREIAA